MDIYYKNYQATVNINEEQDCLQMLIYIDGAVTTRYNSDYAVLRQQFHDAIDAHLRAIEFGRLDYKEDLRVFCERWSNVTRSFYALQEYARSLNRIKSPDIVSFKNVEEANESSTDSLLDIFWEYWVLFNRQYYPIHIVKKAANAFLHYKDIRPKYGLALEDLTKYGSAEDYIIPLTKTKFILDDLEKEANSITE